MPVLQSFRVVAAPPSVRFLVVRVTHTLIDPPNAFCPSSKSARTLLPFRNKEPRNSKASADGSHHQTAPATARVKPKSGWVCSTKQPEALGVLSQQTLRAAGQLGSTGPSARWAKTGQGETSPLSSDRVESWGWPSLAPSTALASSWSFSQTGRAETQNSRGARGSGRWKEREGFSVPEAGKEDLLPSCTSRNFFMSRLLHIRLPMFVLSPSPLQESGDHSRKKDSTTDVISL